MNALWRIYDDREVEYLKKNGFRYELLMRDVRSNKLVFIYLNSNELQETIKQYDNKVLV